MRGGTGGDVVMKVIVLVLNIFANSADIISILCHRLLFYDTIGINTWNTLLTENER